MSRYSEQVLEFLAAAHEPRKSLVAVDIRSGNIGRPAGVMWVETEIALAAIASAMSAGTAATTQIGAGLQPASAVPHEDAADAHPRSGQ